MNVPDFWHGLCIRVYWNITKLMPLLRAKVLLLGAGVISVPRRDKYKIAAHKEGCLYLETDRHWGWFLFLDFRRVYFIFILYLFIIFNRLSSFFLGMAEHE